jgi:hypothetical protein
MVPGMDTLFTSTVLLLLTALRSTYSAAPGRQDVMGQTFVGLQVVLKGLVSWLLTSGAGSQTIRPVRGADRPAPHRPQRRGGGEGRRRPA